MFTKNNFKLLCIIKLLLNLIPELVLKKQVLK